MSADKPENCHTWRDREHDWVSVEDRDLPPYCWHFRCRKCGAECSDPAEFEPVASQYVSRT